MKNKIVKMGFEEKLARLQPIELLGVAKMLNVSLVEPQLDPNEKPAPRDGVKIVEDVVARYDSLNRTQKRNLNLILNSLVANGREIIRDRDVL